MSGTNLILQVRRLMKQGIYDPDELFRQVYINNRVHYSKVREAVQIAKNL
jgi:hypothetical protein